MLDAALGDPRRWHPVAGFGQAGTWLEKRIWRDSSAQGALHVLACVGPVVALGVVAQRVSARRPWVEVVTTAAATWIVLGGASLGAEAMGIYERLKEDDLQGARDRLPNLCGRDPSGLDSVELARATVESVAENTSDAVVAPLVWGAVAGIPGLLGYRAINTLDAMIGHRSPRYARYGKAAARLDDAVNLVPSRLTALALAASAPVVGGRSADALRAWRRDASKHPSPNAGPVEAAAAGALGIHLGGVNRYDDVVDDRGTLGDGPAPSAADIPRVVRLCQTAGVLCLAACAGVAIGLQRRAAR